MADDDNSGKSGYKIIALVSSLAGATIARKVLTLVWTKATGKEPPANPEHPDVTWAEAMAWAGVSGIVVAMAKLVAQRQAAATWHRASGELPPGMEKTAA
jgi:NhaP-type Na+/H+ or K+/H+ antiporter